MQKYIFPSIILGLIIINLLQWYGSSSRRAEIEQHEREVIQSLNDARIAEQNAARELIELTARLNEIKNQSQAISNLIGESFYISNSLTSGLDAAQIIAGDNDAIIREIRRLVQEL